MQLKIQRSQPTLDLRKFRDPLVTAKGEARAHVARLVADRHRGSPDDLDRPLRSRLFFAWPASDHWQNGKR